VQALVREEVIAQYILSKQYIKEVYNYGGNIEKKYEL